MRKKLQMGLCILLVLVTISGVLGIWISQMGRNRRPKDDTIDKQEGETSWTKENGIDWDAYFEQGGYFGDYGDESVTYNKEEVKGIEIKAEYATVHVTHSDEVTGIEVFTQIDQESDAISCRLIDGIISIIQANLDEDNQSDGSYIEVTVPMGVSLESLKIIQQDGITSIALEEYITEFSVNMDGGSLVAEKMCGKNASIAINSGSVHIKEARYEDVCMEVETGAIRMNVLDVLNKLKLRNEDGTISMMLWEMSERYTIDIRNTDGTVELDGEDYVPTNLTQQREVVISGEVNTGSIYIDTDGKED